MASLKHWVRGGTTIATGTTHSGSIGGVGTNNGSNMFTFPNNHKVTNEVQGAYTEFSASSITRLKNLVNDVTGDGISIPVNANESLFGGNYSTRAFMANASNSDNSDFKGDGDHINASSASIIDGVVGN